MEKRPWTTHLASPLRSPISCFRSGRGKLRTKVNERKDLARAIVAYHGLDLALLKLGGVGYPRVDLIGIEGFVFLYELELYFFGGFRLERDFAVEA